MADSDTDRSSKQPAEGLVSHWVSFGKAMGAQQRWGEAVEAFRRAVDMSPSDANILSNLAVALLKNGWVAEAEQRAKQAFALDHSNAAICANLGACLLAQRRCAEAAQAFQAALASEPANVEVWCNLGLAFHAQEKYDDAIRSFQRALELEPDRAQTHVMLADVLKEQGQIDEAIHSYRRAIELGPRFAEAHNNLGGALELQGKLDEAADCYEQALAMHPGLVEAHWNRAVLTLLKGDFEQGWADYEWQWKKIVTREFAQPRWRGEDIAGKTILLTAEQALGDTIHFIRYVRHVERLGATVIVECLRPLLKIAATCVGPERLIARGDPLPPFDVYAPLLSLPGIFKTTLETIPAEVPYLLADATLVAEWRGKLASKVEGQKSQGGAVGTAHSIDQRPLLVGINWRGSGVRQARGTSRQRDLPVEMFERLAGVPGVRLVSLQKQEPVGANAECRIQNAELRSVIINLGPIDTDHGPFMDTAAIMMNLDLVISSDTSVAHLAGALGVPVWVALPFVPDWRWLLNRSDSPWYPTMRLFRQRKIGDWEGIFEEMEAELRKKVSGEL